MLQLILILFNNNRNVIGDGDFYYKKTNRSKKANIYRLYHFVTINLKSYLAVIMIFILKTP